MRLLNNDVLEVTILNDLFREEPIKDKKSGQIIGMKSIVTKKGIETRMLMSRYTCWPSEYLNKNGTISKKRLLIYDSDSKRQFVAKGNYEEVKQVIFQEHKTTVKGYGR